ncbi:MAG: type 4a pilus biogenesis protein PilO, partial [Candidatus Binatia bacterium]
GSGGPRAEGDPVNELFERLFELEPSRRLAVYAGGIAVILGLYWYFLFAPAQAMIAEKSKLVEDKSSEKTTKTRMIARLPQIKEEVKQLEAQLRAALSQLPDQKEIPELLSTVSTVGREAGLDILVFRQRPENLKEFYAEVPVEMVMRGNYRQVTSFLDAVGKLNRIVNVTNISLKNPTVRPDGVIIDTSCTSVTFRFLSEEERAKIAAQKKAEEAKGK